MPVQLLQIGPNYVRMCLQKVGTKAGLRQSRPRGYKTFFMLNSAELEI